MCQEPGLLVAVVVVVSTSLGNSSRASLDGSSILMRIPDMLPDSAPFSRYALPPRSSPLLRTGRFFRDNPARTPLLAKPRSLSSFRRFSRCHHWQAPAAADTPITPITSIRRETEPLDHSNSNVSPLAARASCTDRPRETMIFSLDCFRFPPKQQVVDREAQQGRRARARPTTRACPFSLSLSLALSPSCADQNRARIHEAE